MKGANCRASCEKFVFERIAAPCIRAQSFAFSTISLSSSSGMSLGRSLSMRLISLAIFFEFTENLMIFIRKDGMSNRF